MPATKRCARRNRRRAVSGDRRASRACIPFARVRGSALHLARDHYDYRGHDWHVQRPDALLSRSRRGLTVLRRAVPVSRCGVPDASRTHRLGAPARRRPHQRRDVPQASVARTAGGAACFYMTDAALPELGIDGPFQCFAPPHRLFAEGTLSLGWIPGRPVGLGARCRRRSAAPPATGAEPCSPSALGARAAMGGIAGARAAGATTSVAGAQGTGPRSTRHCGSSTPTTPTSCAPTTARGPSRGESISASINDGGRHSSPPGSGRRARAIRAQR